MFGPSPPRYALGCAAVAQEPQDEGLREKLSRQGEEALGRIAEELAANPLVTGAISRAFDAREKAVQAQEAAMGALGIPSAADIERLTRRLRSVSLPSAPAWPRARSPRRARRNASASPSPDRRQSDLSEAHPERLELLVF